MGFALEAGCLLQELADVRVELVKEARWRQGYLRSSVRHGCLGRGYLLVFDGDVDRRAASAALDSPQRPDHDLHSAAELSGLLGGLLLAAGRRVVTLDAAGVAYLLVRRALWASLLPGAPALRAVAPFAPVRRLGCVAGRGRADV